VVDPPVILIVTGLFLLSAMAAAFLPALRGAPLRSSPWKRCGRSRISATIDTCTRAVQRAAERHETYSVRSACAGEVALARKAGTSVAISANTPSMSTAVARRMGS
jgi:hypothetical protein